jgi:protein SSD1
LKWWFADEMFALASKEIAKIAEQCNIKKDGAKNAQDASIQLYLAEYIHRYTEMHGPMYREATIIAVVENAYDIFVPEYGIEKRLYLDRMALKKSTFDEANMTLILEWQEGVEEMDGPDPSSETSLKFNDEQDLDELINRIERRLSLTEEQARHEVNVGPNGNDQPKEISEDVSSLPHKNTCAATANQSSQATTTSTQNGKLVQQVIKIFGRVKVRIEVNMERSPPILNVHSVRP